MKNNDSLIVLNNKIRDILKQYIAEHKDTSFMLLTFDGVSKSDSMISDIKAEDFTEVMSINRLSTTYIQK